jgi:hypothetical protein
MIRNLIAVTIGGLVTFGFLVFWDATDFIDPIPAYALAALVGAVGSLIWPILVGWWLAGRARDRRVEKEVEKQMADQGK